MPVFAYNLDKIHKAGWKASMTSDEAVALTVKEDCNMQAVIMAGGKGTRLSSLTGGKIPKPMVDVDGMPLLERQILT